jgi:hypothetical protein
MADRICAEIRIGGQISRTAKMKDTDETVLNCLISMINGAEVSHEYGDAVAQIPVNEEDDDDSQLLQYLDEEGHFLRFRDEQAHNGEFEALEEFLVAHDIPYERWHDHYCEWDAENVYFRPGMNAPVVTYADSRGQEIVCGQTVRSALDLLKQYVADRDDEDLVDEALHVLEAACPKKAPPMEVFEITP